MCESRICFYMKTYKRYTVTSALPYANGPLHIGHIAGAYLPADIYVRYLRLQGKEVAFICGSDEHGAAITIKAIRENTTPRAIIDRYHPLNKKTFERLGISFDIYHRTSEKIHHELSQEFFLNLYEKGEFVEKETEQYYDEKHKQFLADRYITGTCPNCGYEGAYGDQCEKCGTSLDPRDLINPRSILSGEVPVLKKTKHWYLPLDKYQPWLEEWLLEGKKQQWKNNVYGQCSSWLKSGLQPRSVTRDLEWGVDVPLDTEEARGKKLYVWLDAPIGYISATKQWALDHGKDWEKYWKKQEKEEDNACLIHFIGKDNIVFHCIIFPSILHMHGDYILPENVPANEFLNLEGEKLSTSRNWAVWLNEYLDDFPGKEDVLRYVLASILPETKDSEFTWKDYQARNNNELVAIFGNFVNRALVLTHKYFGGKVPPRGELSRPDRETLQELGGYPGKISLSIEQFRFREALAEMMNLARLGNKYLADTEPWKLIKTDEARAATVLNISLQIAASLSVLAEPFLPFTTRKLRKMLGIDEKAWEQAGDGYLVPENHQLGEPALLFEKIDDKVVEAQVQKLVNARRQNELEKQPGHEPAKRTITFDDFSKMDIRIGTILEAEKVPKTSKLMKLKIDTGLDRRIVVSGIAGFFTPEEIIGRQVSILVNLAPRKIRGIESQGMILMAEDKDGKLHFVAPPETIASGSTVS